MPSVNSLSSGNTHDTSKPQEEQAGDGERDSRPSIGQDVKHEDEGRQRGRQHAAARQRQHGLSGQPDRGQSRYESEAAILRQHRDQEDRQRSKAEDSRDLISDRSGRW